jgi:hypothetical protein
MKKPELKVSFNIKWAKSVKKAHFIKTHEKAYPELDLGDIYDKIVGKRKKDELEVSGESS